MKTPTNTVVGSAETIIDLLEQCTRECGKDQPLRGTVLYIAKGMRTLASGYSGDQARRHLNLALATSWLLESDAPEIDGHIQSAIDEVKNLTVKAPFGPNHISMRARAIGELYKAILLFSGNRPRSGRMHLCFAMGEAMRIKASEKNL